MEFTDRTVLVAGASSSIYLGIAGVDWHYIASGKPSVTPGRCGSMNDTASSDMA